MPWLDVGMMDRSLPVKKIASIQMLRAIAALMVVGSHFMYATKEAHFPTHFNSIGHLNQVLGSGVDLFFIISGFIIVHIGSNGFGKRGKAIDFLQKRFARIYPTYWAVTVIALILWSTGLAFKSQMIDFQYVVGSFLCFPMNRHPIVDQGWTLSYELYFYILYSAGIQFLRSVKGFLIISFVWFTISFLFSREFPDCLALKFLGTPMLFEFWFGALIGFLYKENLIKPSPKLAMASFMLGLGCFCIVIAFGTHGGLRIAELGVPSFLWVLAAVYCPPISSGFLNWLVLLGNASYSIYLTHGLFTLAFPRVVGRFSLNRFEADLMLFIYICLALFFGCAFWRYIEVPLQVIFRRCFVGEAVRNNN